MRAGPGAQTCAYPMPLNPGGDHPYHEGAQGIEEGRAVCPLTFVIKGVDGFTISGSDFGDHPDLEILIVS